MKERYDVIVAGAGLAGSLAAGMAAKGGANGGSFLTGTRRRRSARRPTGDGSVATP